MKVLITGVAGTGKSTIVKALNERGIAATDLHDIPGLCFWQNKETKEIETYTPVHLPNWFDTVVRLCNIDQLKKLLNQNEDIIVAGTAGDNQAEYLPLFDKIILLQASPEVIVQRMETRTNKSGFGKTKAEQEDNVEWQKEFDPELLSYGAIPVSTEQGLEKTLNKIFEVIGKP